MRRLDLIYQCPFFKGTTEYDELMKDIDEYLKGYLGLDYETVDLNYTYVIGAETTIYPVNLKKIQIKLEYDKDFSLSDMQEYESLIVEKIKSIVWEVH